MLYICRPSIAERFSKSLTSNIQKVFDGEDKGNRNGHITEVPNKKRTLTDAHNNYNYHKDYSYNYTNDVDYTSAFHMESPLLLMVYGSLLHYVVLHYRPASNCYSYSSMKLHGLRDYTIVYSAI